MGHSTDPDAFQARLRSFHPARFETDRALALYSAAIAVSEENCLKEAVRLARVFGATVQQLYEVLLQSYLFLGFPRMLIASGYLGYEPPVDVSVDAPDSSEMAKWYPRGRELCKKVYDSNFEKLRSRVQNMAPEIFQWMLLEGYGKVLSRPGLAFPVREAAIVACLTVDNRPSQLYSHARGALNVVTPPELLVDVVDDLCSAAAGYGEARAVLQKLRVT